MDAAERQAIQEDIATIRKLTGVPADQRLLDSYLSGGQVPLTYYDKIAEHEVQVPALVRVLLVLESHLRQPDASLFFDVFRVARYLPFTRILASALRTVTTHSSGYEQRLERLATAIEFDDFEATLFEFVVAARYAVHPAATGLAFISESSTPTPDFSVQTRRGRLHVECKKFDRMTDASPRIRDAVRDATTPLIHALDSENVSAVIEWKIATQTPQFDSQQLVRDAFGSLVSGGAIVRPEGTVLVKRIVPLGPCDDLILVPSPAYFWDQFEYASRGPWRGLVDAHRGQMTGPSYAVALTWVAGVKWAVTNEEVMQRTRRFGYARIFKGLEQLEAAGGDTVLHVCLERIAGVGPRVAELRHFVETLKEKRKRFGWLIFNEFEIDVTMGRRFDFQEHAHFVPGTSRFGREPPVLMVFVPGDGVAGPFGIGATLPSLDDE